MITSSTYSQAIVATKTTPTTTMATPKFTVNINEQNFNDLIENISDIKLWIKIIAIIIVKIVLLKVIKMCKKAYQMHNEKIIQRHSRFSPQI